MLSGETGDASFPLSHRINSPVQIRPVRLPNAPLVHKELFVRIYDYCGKGDSFLYTSFWGHKEGAWEGGE